MATQAVNLGYDARDPFIPLHTRRQRFGCIVAHRRAGKTVASVLDLIDAALRCDKPDPRFAYVAPYYAQAKDVVWAYVKRYAGQIPGVTINESELRVDFPHNGARLRLYGADNYDRLRGIYLDGVVLDEFADQPPQAWREVIRPALSDRQGWALFIGTPKGRNAFYDVYQAAVANDDWFDLKLKASETGLIPDSELAALKADMSRNEYAREMECDFDAAIEGAYFADGMSEAREQGRITDVAQDPLMAVRAYTDIGGPGAKADAFAMWVCQFVGQKINVLDYYEAQGQPLAEHVNWLRSRGWGRAEIFLPHDGLKEGGVNPGSFESAFREAGFSATTLRGEGSGNAGAKTVRIEAVRRLLPRIWFNETTTQGGRDALIAYHEKRDEKRGIGLGPEHDWASHGCFTADTKVLTRYGMRRIDSLEKTGEVLTPCGWKRYVAPRITKRDAPLVEVAFASGYSVRCTPDHLFLTERGWQSAESLRRYTVIQSTLTSLPNISTGGFTGFGQAMFICRAAAESFTGMLGALLSGRSLEGATFTTATAMSSTTGLRTWNASPLQSIFQNLAPSALLRRMDGFRLAPETRRQIGTARRKAGSGTRDTRSAARVGRNGSARKSLASIVANPFRHWFGKAGMPASIVARLARSQPIANAAKRTNTPLRIERVRRLSETADVWDITVPDGHCFSLENGAVVHNSDAFGLMCVAYEEPRKAQALDLSRLKGAMV